MLAWVLRTGPGTASMTHTTHALTLYTNWCNVILEIVVQGKVAAQAWRMVLQAPFTNSTIFDGLTLLQHNIQCYLF